MSILGCPVFTQEARFLRSAKQKATEHEVRTQLGEPARVTSNQNAEGVWVYHRREYVEGGNNSWSTVGTWWCDTYTLTFDERRILRDWTGSTQKCAQ